MKKFDKNSIFHLNLFLSLTGKNVFFKIEHIILVFNVPITGSLIVLSSLFLKYSYSHLKYQITATLLNIVFLVAHPTSQHQHIVRFIYLFHILMSWKHFFLKRYLKNIILKQQRLKPKYFNVLYNNVL